MANPKVNWNGTTADGGFVSLTWSTASTPQYGFAFTRIFNILTSLEQILYYQKGVCVKN